MFYVWAGAGIVGHLLQILVLSVMLRGAYRRYGALFGYTVVLFVTTAVEAVAFYWPRYAAISSTDYWIFDSIRQVLLYVVVISLIFSASDQSAKRSSIGRFLITGSVLFAALSLYFTYNRGLDFWMTRFSRNLGFLAVILNLVLWAALLKHRRPDQTLLLVTGGMGIQMAGKAIGHALRQLSHSTVTIGNLVIVLSHLLCLYIWWQAFRKPSEQPVAIPD
jgi:hypothetical protein